MPAYVAGGARAGSGREQEFCLKVSCPVSHWVLFKSQWDAGSVCWVWYGINYVDPGFHVNSRRKFG